MDISRAEQRILHLLAQGGHIRTEKDGKRLARAEVFTREGWRYPDFDIALFGKLKRRRTIASKEGGPYRITRRGLELVRGQLDNR